VQRPDGCIRAPDAFLEVALLRVSSRGSGNNRTSNWQSISAAGLIYRHSAGAWR
ncbi:uncharacterized protein METZ01_LOCUS145849, partial [marine metagenome]